MDGEWTNKSHIILTSITVHLLTENTKVVFSYFTSFRRVVFTRSSLFNLYECVCVCVCLTSAFCLCSPRTVWPRRPDWRHHLCCHLPGLHPPAVGEDAHKERPHAAGAGSHEQSAGESKLQLSLFPAVVSLCPSFTYSVFSSGWHSVCVVYSMVSSELRFLTLHHQQFASSLTGVVLSGSNFLPPLNYVYSHLASDGTNSIQDTIYDSGIKSFSQP